VPRDNKGRFLPSQASVSQALQWDLVVTLLERIAYNTAQTHLTFDEYLRSRVYKDGPHADHSADD
jgi:hypothetical protein